MTSLKVPRILSFKVAKPGSPVRIYAVVQSTNRPNKVLHTVTKVGRFDAEPEPGQMLVGL
jgi:hypothetical protein